MSETPEQRDRFLAALSHTPDRAEILEILETYFVGPISAEVHDTIAAEFHHADTSKGRWASLQSSYESQVAYSGQAWNEEAIDRRWMTRRDAVSLIASMYAEGDQDNFPPPKRYCPQPYVGTWRQLEPAHDGEPILWHLAADGAFRSNSPDVPAGFAYWCINRSFDERMESLLLHHHRVAPLGVWPILDMRVSGSEMSGTFCASNQHYDVKHRWRRYG